MQDPIPDVGPVEPPSSRAWPSFPVRPYKPDGGYRSSGLMLLFTSMVIAGAVLGFVAHFIAQWFYLIVLFPVLIGFGMGFAGRSAVKKGNVRSPLFGGLAGLLGGICAMLMMHWWDYDQFKRDIAQVPTAKVAATLTEAERREAIDSSKPEDRAGLERFLEAARVSSFPQFMELEAHRGVEISHRGSKGMNLGYYGSYIYWGIEMLVVAGVSFALVKGATEEPFCAGCNAWKKDVVLGHVGDDPGRAKSAVDSGQVEQIVLARGRSEPTTNTRLTVSTCPFCGVKGDADVKLESVLKQRDGKDQTKTLSHLTYPGTAAPVLTEALAI